MLTKLFYFYVVVSIMDRTELKPHYFVIETHTVFKKLKLVYYWSMLCKIYFSSKNVKCHSRWYCVLMVR